MAVGGTPLNEGRLLGEKAPERVVGAPRHLGLIDLLHCDKLGGEVAVRLENIVEDPIDGVRGDSMDEVEIAFYGRRWQWWRQPRRRRCGRRR